MRILIAYKPLSNEEWLRASVKPLPPIYQETSVSGKPPSHNHQDNPRAPAHLLLDISLCIFGTRRYNGSRLAPSSYTPPALPTTPPPLTDSTPRRPPCLTSSCPARQTLFSFSNPHSHSQSHFPSRSHSQSRSHCRGFPRTTTTRA